MITKMNERIDELMIQAGAKFEFLHGVHYDDFQYRKFAELIVRECLDIAYEYDAPKMSGPGMIIAGRIETHFGVEY